MRGHGYVIGMNLDPMSRGEYPMRVAHPDGVTTSIHPDTRSAAAFIHLRVQGENA